MANQGVPVIALPLVVGWPIFTMQIPPPPVLLNMLRYAPTNGVVHLWSESEFTELENFKILNGLKIILKCSIC
jgi:hypothetical protein